MTNDMTHNEQQVARQPSTLNPSKLSKKRLCGNCQFELDGPYCGRCGQPEQSMIRFFGSVIMHFLDDILLK